MKPCQDNIHKILVVTLSNLGDVILTLPVFRSLTAAFPKAVLHAVTGPAAAGVLSGDPRIEKVIPYNKKIPWRARWDFIRRIRQEHYDLIVDLRRSPIGFFGGARFRNSYLAGAGGAHRAVRHLAALRGIAPVSTGESFLRVTAAGESGLQGLMASEAAVPRDGLRLVVAAPGSKSDVKKWPAERYAELLDRLAVNDGCRIILIGDRNDAADTAKIRALMTSRPVDLAGRTDFQQLCAAIKRADLVVTNDSAPLHIADALGVPVLAIFGPTDPRKYGPRAPGSIAVRREVFCSPCESAQCRYARECMTELPVAEVYRKARQILHDEPVPQGQKILAVRLDRIGDLTLSLPALSAIKERFPHSKISVMTRPVTSRIVEDHPLVDEVIPYAYEKGGRHRFVRGNIRFILEIVRRRFDIVFILNPSLRSYLVPFVAQIPYRAGFRVRWPFLLTHGVFDRRREGKKHESDYTMDVVRAFGIKPGPFQLPVLPVSPYDTLRISERIVKASWNPGDRIIAIHPGASCPSKRWPLEHFAALGRKILETGMYRPAIIGGPGEIELGSALSRAFGDGILDLTGKLDLRQLAAFLKRCDALVSNDSGPVHIAAAVGTPVLSLFGRTEAGLSPVRWRPLGPGHAVLQKDVGCVVCLAHRCTIGFECLKTLEPGEVFASLRGILNRSPKVLQEA